MYTISCCSGSSVPNVDPSPSRSQLNSSIEIFSQLPVFSVGSTCSSSCFCFLLFQRVCSPPSLVPRDVLFPPNSLWTPNTSSLIRHYPFKSWVCPLQSLICLPFYLFHRVSICPDFLALRFLFPQKSCHFRTN